ncbi:hypothetical protein [Pseudobacteroides cellulosolvens]|uniref:Uncharacterized protein n=1 Tax=Pseudobacteroides cellulosolvens ATCC 35603 = DSM 2933 TaxID=398512 RepID=A0A0L6JKX4_9FIRM|nr:hypothetical protein [Pseudobacteroides cellulosolvens]KNY26363.1 hypothetical protein Bccel_1625 [Pseudobacteroides cellulosolvens ATCC 35603 = DSM 2933]
MKVHMKPIEMIYMSTTAGKLTPIKFKMPTDKGELVIKIEKIIKSQEEKISGSNIITYTCQSTIAGSERLFELRYEIRSCRWFLHKI